MMQQYECGSHDLQSSPQQLQSKIVTRWWVAKWSNNVNVVSKRKFLRMTKYPIVTRSLGHTDV